MSAEWEDLKANNWITNKSAAAHYEVQEGVLCLYATTEFEHKNFDEEVYFMDMKGQWV